MDKAGMWASGICAVLLFAVGNFLAGLWAALACLCFYRIVEMTKDFADL